MRNVFLLLCVATFPALAGAAGKEDPDALPDPESLPPVLAPFSQPSKGVMPPPAPLAGIDAPDASSNLEKKFVELQSEAVVTTASKREQRIRDVPLTISWIPAEELEGTGQFTLCDSIQYFPGMECRRGAMRKAAISARGLGSNFLSNRLLLLQDGRPDTDPWTGVFYPDETTPMTNLKQIEVIRGPGSSLYGSNAFSGVINMVHRTPDDLMNNGRDYGVDVRALIGQNNTERLQATVAGKAGDLKALVNYYGTHADGPHLLDLSDKATAAKGVPATVDTQEWDNVQQVSGHVEYKALGVDAEYTTADLGRPGGTEVNTVGTCGRCHYTPNDSEHVQDIKGSIHYDQQVTDWLRIYAQGYTFIKRRVVDLENDITKELEPALGKRRRLGAEARATISTSGFVLTLGGDVKVDTVNNENILPTLTPTDVHQNIYGAFADAEYRPVDKLVLSAGVRYDVYQIPKNVWANPSGQTSPRASIVFNALPSLTLRANYGHAFRAPTLAELAIDQQMYAATLLGNPNLTAETLDMFEVSVDAWPVGEKVRLTATGFYSNAQNFINQVMIFGSSSQFENIGDARVAGAELEAAAQVPAINSSFDVSYQYLNARSLPNDGSPSQTLDYAPSARVYARGRTNIKGFAFVELYALYVGARRDPSLVPDRQGNLTTHVQLPGYLVANARVGAKVFQGIQVSLIAQNLFNTQYQEMYGFPMQGISVFGEVKWTY